MISRPPSITAARLAVVAVLLATLAPLGGCDTENPIFMAPGSYGDLAVVVSNDDLARGLDPFRRAFNVEHEFVLSTEPRFRIDVFGPDEWELCQGFKNILFVWRVGDGGPVGDYLQDKLTAAGEDLARSASGALLQIEEPFQTYQHAYIASATDDRALLSYLRRNAVEIRVRMEESSAKRIMRRYRHDGLAIDAMNRIWFKHRFFLEIPAEFRVSQDAPDGYPAVEIMQNAPPRVMTVGWTSSVDPELLLRQRPLLLELRREMGLKMRDEELVPELLTWSEDTIAGRPAVRLEGAWSSRNPREADRGGGPFWCWFIADPVGQRVYCLDALVHAPGAEKMDYFRRMQAILGTFALERPQP